MPLDRLGLRIQIGDSCRVDGVIHSYLGDAHLPDGEGIVYVFARREWLPDTPGQLPVTLVRDDMTSSVTLTGRDSVR